MKSQALRGIVIIVICLIIIAVAVQQLNADPVSDLLQAEKACKWVYVHIKYVRSPAVNKLPMRTIADFEGDCTDMAILMADMLAQDGIDANIHWMDLPELNDRHALVELYGYLFDPTKGVMYHDGFPIKHRTNIIMSYSMLLLENSLIEHVKAARK